LVHEAAWAAAEGLPASTLAPMAKLFSAQMFRDVTATGQQIFGGVGFTLEYDIQLYFRRAKALQIGWWSDRHLEELIAASILDR
jgi:alkylation response protein AidB-like acyl-CoA dehydrogenase